MLKGIGVGFCFSCFGASALCVLTTCVHGGFIEWTVAVVVSSFLAVSGCADGSCCTFPWKISKQRNIEHRGGAACQTVEDYLEETDTSATYQFIDFWN